MLFYHQGLLSCTQSKISCGLCRSGDLFSTISPRSEHRLHARCSWESGIKAREQPLVTGLARPARELRESTIHNAASIKSASGKEKRNRLSFYQRFHKHQSVLSSSDLKEDYSTEYTVIEIVI